MKRIMLSMFAVAILVAFSAPAFATEEGKKKEEKKSGKLTQMVYGEEKKKEEKKPAPAPK
ncbi:MAG: hypothetical protein ABW047_16085 [Nitrospiraceae bacterium]